MEGHAKSLEILGKCCLLSTSSLIFYNFYDLAPNSLGSAEVLQPTALSCWWMFLLRIRNGGKGTKKCLFSAKIIPSWFIAQVETKNVSTCAINLYCQNHTFLISGSVSASISYPGPWSCEFRTEPLALQTPLPQKNLCSSLFPAFI